MILYEIVNKKRTLDEQIGLPENTIPHIHEIPVAGLPGLSPRALKALKSAGIRTLGELVRLSDSELLSIHDFGQTSLVHVKSALRRFARGERGTSSPPLAVLADWLAADPSIPREMTLQEIGDALGVSRERARQLLNRLGVSERKGRARVEIGEDHPGYPAYTRALSRGACESAARKLAFDIARMQDPAYREQRKARQRARSRRRYHGDGDYRAKLLQYYRERAAEIRERQRRRYREDPAYRARVLEKSRKARAKRRQAQEGKGSAVAR